MGCFFTAKTEVKHKKVLFYRQNGGQTQKGRFLVVKKEVKPVRVAFWPQKRRSHAKRPLFGRKKGGQTGLDRLFKRKKDVAAVAGNFWERRGVFVGGNLMLPR